MFGGTNGYIIVNILSKGAVIFSNVLNLQERTINDAICFLLFLIFFNFYFFFIGHNFLSTKVM